MAENTVQSNYARLKVGKRTHLCYLIREYLREEGLDATVNGHTDELVLSQLRSPYETYRRAQERKD